MADTLDYTGLTTSTYDELLTDVQNTLTAAYSPNGEPIDFSSNTPDGQFSNLLATIGRTNRELLTLVYNATDPSKCDGTQQDTKYQLNYLFRKGGTYTIQPIAITANKTVTLQGLDGSYNDSTATAYTVSDDSGNYWYLIDTTTITSGTTTLSFRAQEQGAVTPTIGEITTQVTIVDGITNVINNVNYTTLGTEQESNVEFRLRRDQSVANESGNNLDTIIGNILNLNGVTACRGWQNSSDETDSTGTAAHTIWLVVNGGANSDIADILYTNLAGSDTRGAVSIDITNVAGQTITIRFDRPNVVPYYIKFDLKDLTTTGSINTQGIKEGTVNNLDFALGQNVDVASVYKAVQAGIDNQGGECYVQNLQVSLGGSGTATTTSTAITNIAVNNTTFQDAIGTYVGGDYVFTYDGTSWYYSGDNIEISDYGITFDGTPASGDTITVTFTAGAWVNLIEAPDIQTEYLTDTSKIYITVT